MPDQAGDESTSASWRVGLARSTSGGHHPLQQLVRRPLGRSEFCLELGDPMSGFRKLRFSLLVTPGTRPGRSGPDFSSCRSSDRLSPRSAEIAVTVQPAAIRSGTLHLNSGGYLLGRPPSLRVMGMRIQANDSTEAGAHQVNRTWGSPAWSPVPLS